MTVKILLFGYGQMGKMLEKLIEDRPDLEIAGIIDVDNLTDLASESLRADVVIDFSSAAAFSQLASYVERTGTPLVSGSTGYADHGAAIMALGQYAPVIYAENYSIGVNAMAKAVSQLAALLDGDFDVEVVETHHRYKKDAPSGTAQLLIRALDPAGERPLVYGRSPADGPRNPGDIGVHALRGGTVPGEHIVEFFGEDESISITHRAFSRKIFALGALAAADRLVRLPKGSYSFDQLFDQA